VPQLALFVSVAEDGESGWLFVSHVPGQFHRVTLSASHHAFCAKDCRRYVEYSHKPVYATVSSLITPSGLL
jgi:hypothetical protein